MAVVFDGQSPGGAAVSVFEVQLDFLLDVAPGPRRPAAATARAPACGFVFATALWALLSGGLMLGAAFRLHPNHGRIWLALGGIVSIAWGVMLLLAPLLGALVLTCRNMMAEQARDAGLVLETRIAGNLPPEYADLTKVDEVQLFGNNDPSALLSIVNARSPTMAASVSRRSNRSAKAPRKAPNSPIGNSRSMVIMATMKAEPVC